MKAVLKIKTLEEELLELQDRIENELFGLKQCRNFNEFKDKILRGKEE